MKRRSFSITMSEHLKSLRHELDVLKMKADQDPLAKEEMNSVIEELEEKFSVLEERIHDLERARRENQNQVKTGVDRAWEEASVAFDQARSRYLH